MQHLTYWQTIWQRFKGHWTGMVALYIVTLFCLAAIYAPFLASSKPFVVEYEGTWYFPLFRYLFFRGFFTKPLDLFYNLLIFTFPFSLSAWIFTRGKVRNTLLLLCCAIQLFGFIYLMSGRSLDPSSDSMLNQAAQRYLLEKQGKPLTWDEQLTYMTPYAKLNLLLNAANQEEQNSRVEPYAQAYFQHSPQSKELPTLWNERQVDLHPRKWEWIQQEMPKLHHRWMPSLTHFHWEDDAGGSQRLNQVIPFTALTRINQKDLMAALIFGTRISLSVGLLAVALALIIGIPIGAYAGYYGGTLDLLVYRLIEIWESMPTFFMLLMIVAFFQSKSIFLIIAVVGLFGWTSFSRFIRAEFFRQKRLPYVEACHALGYHDGRIMFSHVLPNALPPVLTLIPFAIMGAITSEAGLSFLGLGEENSCSWGVLMDEGRSAFPAESYLLWPPAILLTILLVSIALVGDALRDVLDPKHTV